MPNDVIEKSWREYRKACYPEEIPKVQECECRQAFFSGALITIKLCLGISNSELFSEEEAGKILQDMMQETESACRERVVVLKGRS